MASDEIQTGMTGNHPWGSGSDLLDPPDSEELDTQEGEPADDGEAGDEDEGDQGGEELEASDEDQEDEDGSEEDEESEEEPVKEQNRSRIYARLKKKDEEVQQLKATVQELERFRGGIDQLRDMMVTEYQEDRVTFLRDIVGGIVGRDKIDNELRDLSEDLAFELLQLDSDSLPKETAAQIRMRKLERAQRKSEAQAQRQLREWQRKATEAEAAAVEQNVRGQIGTMISPLRSELPHLFENPLVEDPTAVVYEMVQQRYAETGKAPDVLEMARLADENLRTEVLKFERFFGKKDQKKRTTEAAAGKPVGTDGKRKGLSNAKASRTSAKKTIKNNDSAKRKFNGFGWDDDDKDEVVDTWSRRFREDG